MIGWKRPASRLRRFGSYALLYEIGRGASAVVYVARASEQTEVVALKMSRQPGPDSTSALSIRDEARLLGLLNHPCILKPQGIVEQNDHLGLIEEYVHGDPLNVVMAAGPIPENLALWWTRGLAGALAHAHAAIEPDSGRPLNVVHRDLAPDNILIRYDGSPVLADFGIAMSRATRAETRTGVIKGRLEYLAPEQVAGRRVDGRADVYALGVLLEKMLAGRTLHPLLSATLEAALRPDPSERPAAAAFAWGLARCSWWLERPATAELANDFVQRRLGERRLHKERALQQAIT